MSDKQTVNKWTLWASIVVAVGAFVGGAYWLLIDLWNNHSHAAAEFAAYLIGGALAVCQIVVSSFRANAADKTARAMQQTSASTEKGNVAERFKNAIEHLGHESVSVRLGGIYALHHIAQDEVNYRERVFDILCAHIRETTTDGKYKPLRIAKSSFTQPSVEIESTLELLLGPQVGERTYTQLTIKLTGANLEGLELAIYDANFAYADLRWGNLRGAYLAYANFDKAKLLHADMQGANLENANLSDVDFAHADLSDVNFEFANCQRCDFSKAKNLKGEQLLDVYSLHKAKLPWTVKEAIEEVNPNLFDSPTGD